ncbi:MAG: hypothetical protein R2879_08430 [Saprospiraceae bacterium]
MRIPIDEPKWKIWLSYLFEIHIESSSSELNNNLHVSLKNGRYQLCTDNAIYSYGDLYDNFYKSFQKLKWRPNEKAEVLILGFGLASVPLIMEIFFSEKMYFTGVEADESVIELASNYALPYLKNPVEIRYADAYGFLMTNETKFDCIIMDVFIDDQVPEEFEEPEFLEGLSESLNEDGLIMYNRLAFSKADKSKTLNFYENYFKKVFKEGTYLDVGGNFMLINDKKFLKA